MGGLANECGILECYEQAKQYIIPDRMMIYTDNLDYTNGSYANMGSGLKNHFFNDVEVLHAKWREGFERDIIQYINNEKYILLELDHYRVPGCSSYKKDHFYHGNAMIYGYNLEKEIFYVTDNFVDGKFVILEIGFTDIIYARKHHEHDKSIAILSRDFNDGITYEVDIDLIKTILKGYLHSKNPLLHLTHESKSIVSQRIYGLDVYTYLLRYFELLAEYKVPLDVRGFHVVYNHMDLMLLFLHYIKKRNVLRDVDTYQKHYTSLLGKISSIRTMMLTLGITKEPSLLERIKAIMHDLASQEEQVIGMLLKSLGE